jgi:hypothetical protein
MRGISSYTERQLLLGMREIGGCNRTIVFEDEGTQRLVMRATDVEDEGNRRLL